MDWWVWLIVVGLAVAVAALVWWAMKKPLAPGRVNDDLPGAFHSRGHMVQGVDGHPDLKKPRD